MCDQIINVFLTGLLQGCQQTEEGKQWSLGRFTSADFVIDPQQGFYLQFTDGDDARYNCM